MMRVPCRRRYDYGVHVQCPEDESLRAQGTGLHQGSYRGRLTVPDVARAMGCSERLAELRFREVLGRSIRDEIQDVRLDRVFFYLRCTQRSLGSIANFVGLGDPASLRRFFRRKTGQSLGDWRRDPTEIA